MSMPANIRVSAQFPFPAGVAGTTPIAITKANGIWSVALPLGALATQLPAGGSLTTDYVLVWDSLSGTYFKMPISNIPVGPPGPPGAAGPPGPTGGITDAPSDGVNYGRKNAAWNNLDTVYAPIASAAPIDALGWSGMQINGSMEVSQELGGTGGTAISGQAKYIADGWMIETVGVQSATFGQSSSFSPAGFANSLQISFPTTANPSPAAGDFCIIAQRIEGYRTIRLAWGTANAQPITIGFWVAANRPGTYSGAIANGGSTRSYVFNFTINVGGNVWEYKTVTIPGDTTGTWAHGNTSGLQVIITMMAGSTYTTAANTWTAGTFLGVTGTLNGAAATSDVISLSGVVVLPGIQLPTAARAPFIMRSFDHELMTCKRYYEKSYNYSVASGTASSNIGYNLNVLASNTILANADYGALRWQVNKRANPIVTIYSIAGSSGQVSNGTVLADIGANSGTPVNVGENGCVVRNGSGGTVTTTNLEVIYHYVADARL